MPLIRPNITCHDGFKEPSAFLKIDSSAPNIHISGNEYTSICPSARINVRKAASWKYMIDRDKRGAPKVFNSGRYANRSTGTPYECSLTSTTDQPPDRAHHIVRPSRYRMNSDNSPSSSRSTIDRRFSIERVRRFHTPVASLADRKWINASGSPSDPVEFTVNDGPYNIAVVTPPRTSDRKRFSSRSSGNPTSARSPSGHTNPSRLQRFARPSTVFPAQPRATPIR